jgi:hypothetical protein
VSARLVTLAFDASPAFGGNANGSGHAVGEGALVAMIERYVAAARQDAEEAAIEQRSALDQLIRAEQDRLDAKRLDSGPTVRRCDSAVAAARSRKDLAERRRAEALADCAFAEARLAKPRSALRRGPGMAGQAIRTFAAERLRQLDEIASAWGSDRPSRDRVLLEELRTRFRALGDVKRGH